MGNHNKKTELSPLKRAFIALEDANRRIEMLEQKYREPIAIVGMGCRFPGGAINPERYWDMLKAGQDAVTDIPADRWDAEEYYNSNPDAPGKMSIRRGAFIQDVDKFDAEFFGISPREAKSMDPQQRLLLEVTWEALEDAGIPPSSLNGSATGVFVGMCKSDYGNMHRSSDDPGRFGIYPIAGGAYSMASGRISYSLGLQGPSATIDTACSSSMVALHLACQGLLQGDCKLAITGSVNLILSPENTISFSKADMMSSDGRCKTFDAKANGFVQGEGCGVVVIKRLSDAMADNDHVLAVIRSSAVNQDGPSSGLTAPNGAAQQDVLRLALQRSGFSAADIDYVEAHGTGTSLGDPIEMRALAAVLGEGHSKENPLVVGSVKTNMGHLESAAGIASLIKVVLSLKHRSIPPHLHFDSPSPHIEWEKIPITIPTKLTPWAGKEGGRIAGISSFGFSGTNVHIIVSEAPDGVAPSDSNPITPDIFTISARNDQALDELISRYREFLASPIDADLTSVCRWASAGRTHFPARLTVCADTVADLRSALSHATDKTLPTNVQRRRRERNAEPRVAFLFAGQGSQYLRMGSELYSDQPVYRDAIDRCDRFLRQNFDIPLLDILYAREYSDEEAKRCLHQTSIAQPAIFSVEYALACLWMSWGVVPTAVAGHSVGEYVAACVAGLFDLEDALRLIAIRGKLMQQLPAGGKMAAVFAPNEDVLKVIADKDSSVVVAAVNGPRNTVVSGGAEAVDEIIAIFTKQGIDNQYLQVSHAFHSPLMKPMLGAFKEALRETKFGKLKLSLISNVSGQSARSGDISSPEYWLQHIEYPVRFSESMLTLQERGCEIFIEVGPHPVLTTLGQTCLDDAELVWIQSMRRPVESEKNIERDVLRENLAKFYVAGGTVDWQAVYSNTYAVRCSLPTYPFQRVRHWFDAGNSPIHTPGHQVHPLLGSCLETPVHESMFQLNLRSGMIGFVDDHIVHGRTVLPATAYLEMANAVARERGFGPVEIMDLTLLEALVIPQANVVPIQIVLDEATDGWNFRVYSRREGGTWKLHCEADLLPTDEQLPDLAVVEIGSAGEKVSVPEFYESFFARGLQFGHGLLGISSLERRDGEAVANINVPVELLDELGQYEFHPAVLDACIQVIGAAVPGYRVDDSDSAIFMPIAIERCSIKPTRSNKLVSAGRVVAEGDAGETMAAEVRVWDEVGNLVAHIDGIRMKRVDQSDLGVDISADWLYQTVWREKSDTKSASRNSIGIAVDEMIDVVQATYDSLAEECDLAAYFDSLPKLENIGVGFIQLALLELGWQPKPGEQVTAESLAHRIGVIPIHVRLLNRFLQILSEVGVLTRNADEFIVNRVLEHVDPAAMVEQLIDEWPAGQAETGLVARCGPSLAKALSGKVDPLDLLFPQGNTEAGAAIYTRSPLAQVFNKTVAQIVNSALGQIAVNQKIRILEIGGGTGGTTRFIMDRIDTQRIDYMFTDLGALFVSRAQDRFGHIESMQFQVLDIESDPLKNGFDPGSFDLIIASNVIHATRDLDKTFQNIEQLLAPSGLLVMTEVVARQNWIDTTFGMTEGWWHFSDAERRPDYPLLGVKQWRSYLKERGFLNTVNFPSVRDDEQMSAILLSTGAAAIKADASHASPEPWLIFGDQGGVADVFLRDRSNLYSDRLIQSSPEITTTVANGSTIRANRPGDYDSLFEQNNAPNGIVFLWPLDDIVSRYGYGSGQADIGTTNSCESLLLLLQSLVRNNVELPGGLILVTAGAQSTGLDDAVVEPFQAPVWGFAKVIRQEHPEFNCRIVDLDPGVPNECAGQLAAAIDDIGGETELAFRSGTALVPRLTRMSELASFQGGNNRVLQLGISERGLLDNLSYEETTAPVPGHNEVEIRVHSTGLNFRDVLNALGTYSGGNVPFGSECSGVIESVGAGVTDLSIGDKVLAIAEKSFADRVIANAGLVIGKPKSLSWAKAACLPIAYVTAHYCLHSIGAVKKNERVLVHAGAGGVGMAAVQLALLAGAEVYATAGSPKKREYLREIGVKAALNSRSVEFVNELRSAAGRGGVDIVINSLTDEFIPASLSVLNPGGRFVEIGRSNIWTHEQVSEVRDDIEYCMVDLSEDMRNPSHEMRATFRSVVSLVESGALSGLPVKTFSRDETTAAFRYMAQAKHIGKIAVDAPASDESWVRAEGCYLITGAFGGLGLLVANWLADLGATSLTLLGRSPPNSVVDAAIKKLRDNNVDVEIVIGDVADSSVLRNVFDSFDKDQTPLRGIMHCAGALSDAPIVQQSWANFQTVFKAKVHGAWLLHCLSKNMDLDCFVSFSSIASVLGSPGQSNHCAANSFLDMLAHHRRKLNLPAVSINWGVWSGVGAAADIEVEDKAAARGLSLLAPKDGLRLLDLLLRSGRAQTMVQAIDWTKYCRAMGLEIQKVPYLSEVVQRGKKVPGEREPKAVRSSLRVELDQLPIENRSQFLADQIQEEVARVLGLDGIARLPDDLPLKEAGLDSLMAVELRNSLSKKMDAKLPATLMFDYPTVAAVSKFLEELLFDSLVDESPDLVASLDDDADIDSMFESIENLSEEEVDRLYQRKMLGE